MNNFFKIKIKAKIENVSVIRMLITSFISNLDITIEDIIDIKTAVSEAVTNAIEHGYENNENNVIIIKAYIYKIPETKVIIEIIDHGKGINNINLALTPMYTSKPESDHAGIGFTIMQKFMDNVKVYSFDKKGTKIILSKILKKNL